MTANDAVSRRKPRQCPLKGSMKHLLHSGRVMTSLIGGATRTAQ